MVSEEFKSFRVKKRIATSNATSPPHNTEAMQPPAVGVKCLFPHLNSTQSR